MARKQQDYALKNGPRPPKEKPNGGKTKNAHGFRFINFKFPDEWKASWRALEHTAEQVMTWEERVTMDGYKVTLSCDLENEAFQVTVTNKSGDPRFVDTAFSVRARNLFDARSRAMFIHEVVCETDWSVIDEPQTDVDIW